MTVPRTKDVGFSLPAPGTASTEAQPEPFDPARFTGPYLEYALAGAVADPAGIIGPHLADPKKLPLYIKGAPSKAEGDNEKDGWAKSLAEAVRSNRPYCLVLGECLIVLDFDGDDPAVVATLRRSLADTPMMEVYSRGPQSPRRHLYVFEPDRGRRDKIERTAREVEPNNERLQIIRGDGGRRIRPPGSPHRNGGAAVVVDEDQARRFLSLLVPSADELVAELPRSTRDLIEAGPGKDRSNWDATMLFRLAADGLTDGEIAVLVADRSNRLLDKAWSANNPPERATTYLALTLRGVRDRLEFLASFRSKEEITDYLCRLFDAVSQGPPADFGGLINQQIIRGALSLFIERETTERDIDLRTLAERSAVALSTVRSHWPEILFKEWFRRTSHPVRGRGIASGYRVGSPRFGTYTERHPPSTPSYVPTTRETILKEVSQAAFRNRGGLCQSGRVVLEHFREGTTRTRKELLELTGLPPSTMDSALSRLCPEVVTRVRRGVYQMRPDVDLDVLAEQWGMDRREKAQKLRHEKERMRQGLYALGEALTGARTEEWGRWEVRDSRTVVNTLTGEKVLIEQLTVGDDGKVLVVDPDTGEVLSEPGG